MNRFIASSLTLGIAGASMVANANVPMPRPNAADPMDLGAVGVEQGEPRVVRVHAKGR